MARIQLNKVDYTGGHPQHPQAGNGLVLVIDDGGIQLRRFRELFQIPWQHVTSVAVEGPEQAEKRFTATRLVAFGPLGLAAKKTTSDAYLHVTTARFDVGFHVPKTSAGQLRSQLARWTSRLPSQPPPSPEAPPPPPPPSPAGVADELAKLAHLRDTGVLSPDEFEAAKARLLSA